MLYSNIIKYLREFFVLKFTRSKIERGTGMSFNTEEILHKLNTKDTIITTILDDGLSYKQMVYKWDSLIEKYGKKKAIEIVEENTSKGVSFRNIN